MLSRLRLYRTGFTWMDGDGLRWVDRRGAAQRHVLQGINDGRVGLVTGRGHVTAKEVAASKRPHTYFRSEITIRSTSLTAVSVPLATDP